MTYHHNNKDPNLNNLHHAMEYRDGLPHVRVNLGSDSITITGDVNILDNIRINNTEEQSIPVHLTDDPITVNQGTGGSSSWKVDIGTNGTVKLDSTTLTALENISATVSGTVDIGNWPASQAVTFDRPVPITDNNSSITVDGSVSISSLPEVEIKNDTGNPVPVTWVYGNSADAVPWELQVSRGKIAGVTNLNISGYNGNVGTVFAPIWHNTVAFVYPATASTMRVWSDSASDTNVSVLITGLDTNYNIITETVTLTNGATGVMTTNQFFRINNLAITRTPMNVGVIFCGNSAKTEYYNTIEIGAGRSQQTIYTVPAGYTFYLTQSNFYTNNTGNNVGLYRSWTQSANGVINIILTSPFPVAYASRKVAPRAYGEKTDIQWQVATKSGSAEVGGQIEGFLIANSVS